MSYAVKFTAIFVAFCVGAIVSMFVIGIDRGKRRRAADAEVLTTLLGAVYPQKNF